MAKQNDGELYKGPCGLLKDSAWLTADQLPQDKGVVVTVEAVILRRDVEFAKAGSKPERKSVYGSLRFVGKDKELGLNSTNRNVMMALFGPNTGDWYGKKIELYVDPHVSAFGQIVSAVRIRARKIEASPGKREPGDEG